MGVLIRQVKGKVIRDGSCWGHIDRGPVENGENTRTRTERVPKTNPITP